MTTTLKISLTETEMKLLLKSATLDCRRPEEQARFILRSALVTHAQPTNANSDAIRQDAVAVCS